VHFITPIPAFNDNYIWLIGHPAHAKVVVVDPGDANVVLQALHAYQYQLVAILLTHYHSDHSQGIAELCANYQVPVYGPQHEKVLHATNPLAGGEIIKIVEMDLEFKVLSIPGHTLGHIAFWGQGWLFCGDTLFAGGCGRIFEGDATMMYQSLQSLAALPIETEVYCGHEYTAANLKFAAKVDPNNPELQARIIKTQQLLAAGKPTLPSSIGLELATNPFLRCHIPAVQTAVSQHCGQSLTDPIATFAELREWKNIST
jgi:hydroxyacylglutathione hydrolase